MESISSMKMIAGAASLACLKRSRTRLAPTPTIISMNSEAAMEKNGTSASPATARASSVLPVPGRPLRRIPGDPASQLGVLLGVLEEVDYLDQFRLGLVDAGDVLESGALLGRLIEVAGCDQAPDAAESSSGPAEEVPEHPQQQQPSARTPTGLAAREVRAVGRLPRSPPLRAPTSGRGRLSSAKAGR